MQWLNSPQLYLVGFVVLILLVIILFAKLKHLSQLHKRLDLQTQANELVLDDLQVTFKMYEEKLQTITKSFELKSNEDIQISKQMEHRIKTIKQAVEQTNLSIEQIKSQQPQDKLYSRAYKLAALGADVEEIMSECELPKAEVEMLLSVYKPK